MIIKEENESKQYPQNTDIRRVKRGRFWNKSGPVWISIDDWNKWWWLKSDARFVWHKLRRLTSTARSKKTESRDINVTLYGRHVIWINKMTNVRWRGKIKSTCLLPLSSEKRTPQVGSGAKTVENKHLKNFAFSNHSSWEKIAISLNSLQGYCLDGNTDVVSLTNE